jgi:hypothetical protein
MRKNADLAKAVRKPNKSGAYKRFRTLIRRTGDKIYFDENDPSFAASSWPSSSHTREPSFTLTLQAVKQGNAYEMIDRRGPAAL